jgi:Family of unknown function (DUF6498)
MQRMSASQVPLWMGPQVPTWISRPLTSLLVRTVAHELRKQYPDLNADAIIEIVRDDAPPVPQADALRMLEELRTRLRDSEPAPHLWRRDKLPARAGVRTTWRSTSALLLVAVNLIPLYGVLALGWPVFPTVLLYWLENVVIGVLNVLRMLCVCPRDRTRWVAKLFLVPLFCLHYGMFTAAHGTFVIMLFGGGEYPVQWLQVIEPATRAVAAFDLALPLAALAASHMYSFLWNYLGKGEFRRASLRELTRTPYSRVVVLHLTILFGGWIAMELGSPTWALVVLIGFKIALDLRAHLKAHRTA